MPITNVIIRGRKGQIRKGKFNIFGQEEVKRPGSRGGKWYYNEHGKVVYGERPKPKNSEKEDENLVTIGGQKAKFEPKKKEKQKPDMTQLGIDFSAPAPVQEKPKPKPKKTEKKKQDEGREVDPSEALFLIAERCDGADQKDDIGFNKMDARMFGDQAHRWGDYENLSETEKARLYRMANKYKRQLNDRYGVTKITKPKMILEIEEAERREARERAKERDKERKAAENQPVENVNVDDDFKLGSSKRKVLINIENGRGSISSPYNADFVSEIRDVPSRGWDAFNKVNTFAPKDLLQVVEIVNKNYPDDSFSSFIDRVKSGEVKIYSGKAEAQKKKAEAFKNTLSEEEQAALDTFKNDVLGLSKKQIEDNPGLSNWDKDFLLSNVGKTREMLTSKQNYWIDKIQEKHDKYCDSHLEYKKKLYDVHEEINRKREEENERLRREFAAKEQYKKDLIASQENENLELPKALKKDFLGNGDLYGYQKKGVNWLLKVKKGILGFDTGLGKTLIALTTTMKAQETPEIVKELEAEGLRTVALMILPKSLLYGWKDEIEKWTKGKKAVIIDGTKAQRKLQYKYAKDADFVLTTYGMVQREPEQLQELKCGLKFFDESTRLKGDRTLTAKNAKEYLTEKGYVFPMTATPQPNRPDEVFNVMKLINPEVLGSKLAFRRSYCNTKTVGTPHGYVNTIVGYRNLEGLNQRLRPYVFMKKRTDPDVDLNLPDIQHIEPKLTMDKDQAVYYEKARQGLLNELANIENPNDMTMKQRANLLTAMLRMRQVAISPALIDPNYKKMTPKFEETVNTIEEHFTNSPDKSVVVFSEFKGVASELKKALKDRGFSESEIGIIDGSKSAQERKSVQDGINSGKIKVGFLQLKAAGEGINLQKNATKVFHLTTPWNPALLKQATERVHRQGGKQKVTVFRPIVSGTIEQYIEDIITKKAKLSEAVLGTDGNIKPSKLGFNDYMKLAGTNKAELDKLRKKRNG